MEEEAHEKGEEKEKNESGQALNLVLFLYQLVSN
jgi:hypothetical protein